MALIRAPPLANAGKRRVFSRLIFAMAYGNLVMLWIHLKPQQIGAKYSPLLSRWKKPLNMLLAVALRSEEHTSELQSRFDLVCRLLLEKKKVHLENTSVHLQHYLRFAPVRGAPLPR